MSRAEELYQEHLQDLRRLAKKKGMTFIETLITVSQAYKNAGLHLCLRENASAEEIERLEKCGSMSIELSALKIT